jgi:hypothetical protein
MTVYYGLNFVGQFFPDGASREDVVAVLGELANLIGEDATGVLRAEVICAFSPTSSITIDRPRADEVKAVGHQEETQTARSKDAANVSDASMPR